MTISKSKELYISGKFLDCRVNCADSSEGIEYEKPNQNSFSDYYKPRVRFEGSDKFPNRVYGYDKKRSTIDEITDNLASSSLQKRQVGVVYRDDKPIGILQVILSLSFYFTVSYAILYSLIRDRIDLYP
mgnify:CR=1 FL=1